jgi:radical SAM family uncharacterized protein/radical SAM-linked protein
MTAGASYASRISSEILPLVNKPSRYVAGEWNSVVKDAADVDIRIALAFPDVYEIGMSHLGLKILHQILNRQPRILAERAYAPWTDAEALLRQRGIPLTSHESRRPLRDFDILGFTLQYELCFTTILTMLELAGIPLLASDRDTTHPLVIGGGPGAFAPEPVAEYFDAFLIGDGEDAALELAAVVADAKRRGASRAALLTAVKGISGTYVPLLTAPGDVIRKRTARRLDAIDYGSFPVPYMEIVHDRVSIEAMRGCAQGCRFCQAGYVYRPVREQGASAIQAQVAQAVRGSGYEEISLASLSIADLTCLGEVVPPLMASLTPLRTSLSLPSLRVEALTRHQAITEAIRQVRKTGFTIAPEAGSARLRTVINKTGFDEAAIVAAAEQAARAGWESLKFYFMIGLPTETPADLDDLGRVAREAARAARRGRPRGFGLTVSVSSFVPKPHTPFQWCAQEPMAILREKQAFLKGRLRESRIEFKWHQVESSFLEAALALGGREMSAVIARAQATGCRFDGWTDQLQFDRWQEAFAAAGVDPAFLVNRPRDLEAPLPWDHIDCGVAKAYLLREYRRALEGRETPDCHVGPCQGCGEICQPNWSQWVQEIGSAVESPAVPCDAMPVAAPTPSGQPVCKIHFAFQKVGELRFLSHLELMRALARALRRAGSPVAYTQGFNPQPRLALAQALAVGVAGEGELGELDLALPVAPPDLAARWNAQLAPELKILRAWEAPLHGPSLSAGVRGAVYRIQLSPSGGEASLPVGLGGSGACAEFLAQPHIPVEVSKKGTPTTLDARPFLQDFSVLGQNGALSWEMRLKAGPDGSVKPSAVMRSFLGRRVPPEMLAHLHASLRITRTALALEGQG